MIWTAWALAAGLVASLTRLERRKHALVILFGLLSLQFAKLALSGPPMWWFAGIVWIGAGAAILRIGGSASARSALLIVAAGVCIFPAHIIGGVYGFGNVYLAASDLLGVCALLSIFGPRRIREILRFRIGVRPVAGDS